MTPSHNDSLCSLLPRSASFSPRQIQCDSEGGITNQILEKGKPEHGVIRSLPQGHLLKAVTALLAGVELPAHAESQRQHRKSRADSPPLRLDNSLKKCFVRKPHPSALSLRMLPCRCCSRELGARARLLSSTSRARGTRLALNSGQTQALIVPAALSRKPHSSSQKQGIKAQITKPVATGEASNMWPSKL